MDGSYLSDPEVVQASRQFVCVRLSTYESKEELDVLKNVFIGRSGELENTVFTIYDPAGRKKLVRAGRSPDFAFRSEHEMAVKMLEIAEEYPGRRKVDAVQDLGLPVVGDARLALNVAACDNLPLALVVASDKKRRKAIEAKLAELAWQDAYIGQFIFASASASDASDLKSVEGLRLKEGIAVIAPGQFGQDGKVIAEARTGDGTDAVEKALSRAMEKFDPDAKDYHRHIAKGRQDGVHWKTATPVTDPGIPPGARRQGGRGGPPQRGPGGRPPRRR